MRAIDTSAWIEWFKGGKGTDIVAKSLLEPNLCLVPTVVQLELAKWLMREGSDENRNTALAYISRCNVVVLDSEIALLAAEFSRSHRLSTADAIIYATATHYGADLLTCDKHFQNLSHVIYVPNKSN